MWASASRFRRVSALLRVLFLPANGMRIAMKSKMRAGVEWVEGVFEVAIVVAGRFDLDQPKRSNTTIVFGNYPRVCFYLRSTGLAEAKFASLRRDRLTAEFKAWMHHRNGLGVAGGLDWMITEYDHQECPTLSQVIPWYLLDVRGLGEFVRLALAERNRVPRMFE